jgi:lipoprotein-releasing system permease protein
LNFPYFIARRVTGTGKENRQRSFGRFILRIAVVAVALSVAVMILTTALVRGFKSEIKGKVFGFFGHIRITDYNANKGYTDTFPIDVDQPFYPHIDTIAGIEYEDQWLLFGQEFGKPFWRITNGGIRHIQVFANKPGIIKTKDAIEGIVLKGIGTDFDWEFMRDYLLEGDILTLSDSATSRQIIISQQTADRLNTGVGERFDVNFVEEGNIIRRRLEVAGIYRTGLEEYDRTFALVDIKQIQRLLGWTENQVSGFEVFIDDVEDVNIIAEYLYTNELPSQLYAETIREQVPEIFDWVELQNTNERVIIILMLIVSIINMITALMILILERTNMVGTLKSLGASNWRIRKIFLYYAGYIIGLGLFWGNVIGLTLGFLQQQFKIIKLSEADYYLSYAPIEFNFWSILFINGLTLVTILLFLVLPSYLVTRIDPVKALRFK